MTPEGLAPEEDEAPDDEFHLTSAGAIGSILAVWKDQRETLRTTEVFHALVVTAKPGAPSEIADR